MINKINIRYEINKCRLKDYSKILWELIESFQAFNVIFIHREDSLAITASMFILGYLNVSNSFKLSTLYQPTIPNNKEALQVFENVQ